MEEIIEERRECGKAFNLGNGRTRLEISTGPIHFKEDYDDPNEMWKDIDLSWKGNKIDKVPYILTHDGKTITVINRKTKLEHTLELLDGRPMTWNRGQGKAECRLDDCIIQVIASPYAVRFRKLINKEGAPLRSEFRIEGDMDKVHCEGRDNEGRLKIKQSLKDGILSEAVNETRSLKYPVSLDPTIDEFPVLAVNDDASYRPPTSAYPTPQYARDDVENPAGRDSDSKPWGSCLRFNTVDVAKDSLIHSAFIRFRAARSSTSTGVRTVILPEHADNAAGWPAAVGDLATRLAANFADQPPTFPLYPPPYEAWDNIASWSRGIDYDSVDITPLVQYLVERTGWVANNAMGFLWCDYMARSAVGAMRYAYSFDAVP